MKSFYVPCTYLFIEHGPEREKKYWADILLNTIYRYKELLANPNTLNLKTNLDITTNKHNIILLYTKKPFLLWITYDWIKAITYLYNYTLTRKNIIILIIDI